MRDFLVSDQRTDEQADSRSWMMHIYMTLDPDACMYDAYMYITLDPDAYIYMTLDPDACMCDAGMNDPGP